MLPAQMVADGAMGAGQDEFPLRRERLACAPLAELLSAHGAVLPAACPIAIGVGSQARREPALTLARRDGCGCVCSRWPQNQWAGHKITTWHQSANRAYHWAVEKPNTQEKTSKNPKQKAQWTRLKTAPWQKQHQGVVTGEWSPARESPLGNHNPHQRNAS